MNMNLLISAILTAILLSCSPPESSVVQTIALADSRIELKLPGSYTEFSEDSIDKLIDVVDSESQIMALHTYKSLLISDPHLKIFLDTANYRNNVQVLCGKNIPMNYDSAKILAMVTWDDLTIKAHALGGRLVPMESALKNGNHPYIKLKYALQTAQDTIYQTNYVLQGPERTYGITMASDESEDLETMIKGLKVK